MSLREIAVREGKKKPTRYYSDKQEKHVAKKFGGKQQPNSGATPFAKGDVVLDNWLVECKTCTKNKDSFSIKKEWLEKNNKEALFIGKQYNTLGFNFGPNGKMYYILDENTFNEIINNMTDANEVA